jgi:hypothetical protein
MPIIYITREAKEGINRSLMFSAGCASSFEDRKENTMSF